MAGQGIPVPSPSGPGAVLVTGGAGYIGSVVAADLLSTGREVVVLDDLSTGHPDAVPPDAVFVRGDIADGPLLRRILEAHPIRSVIHLAGRSLVGESVEDPLLYVQANVAKTSALLASLRDGGVRSLVFSSSAAVYGEPYRLPIPEDHPRYPLSPYGLTKKWIEETLGWCERAWGLSWASLRYFNAAGAIPGTTLVERHQPETHLIPRLVEAWRTGRPVELFGADYPTPDGTAIRDYVHVKDLSDAHLRALSSAEAGTSGIYNVGSGIGASVLEVVRALEAVTGSRLEISVCPRRSGDPAVLVADASRITRNLGWRPRLGDIAGIVGSVVAATSEAEPLPAGKAVER